MRDTQEILTTHEAYKGLSGEQIKSEILQGHLHEQPHQSISAYCMHHKADGNLFQTLQSICEDCCNNNPSSRLSMVDIRHRLQPYAPAQWRLQHLLADLKSLDVTNQVSETYSHQIDGGCANIFIRTLANGTTVAEKQICFFDADDREKITKVRLTISLKYILFNEYVTESATRATGVVELGS